MWWFQSFRLHWGIGLPRQYSISEEAQRQLISRAPTWNTSTLAARKAARLLLRSLATSAVQLVPAPPGAGYFRRVRVLKSEAAKSSIRCRRREDALWPTSRDVMILFFFRMHLHGLHNRQNIKIILEYVWRNMVKDRYDVYDIFDMCCIASSFSYKSWCVHNVCTANKEPQTPDGSANLRLVQGAAIRPHSCGKMALEVPLESRCCHS